MPYRDKEKRLQYHRKYNRERISPEYVCWRGIKARCLNPKTESFQKYGAIGITMCDSWKESFEQFFADMGSKPSKRHSIDRIDSTKGYEPGNCRWADPFTQLQNRRNVRRFEFSGELLPIPEIARRLNMKPDTLSNRLRLGWTIEEAVSTPLRVWPSMAHA